MPPFALALPLHAPCPQAEYLVRIQGGAEVRSTAITAMEPCVDDTCDQRLPSREARGRLACDSGVCRWIVTKLPSPLEVFGDPYWNVTAQCTNGSLDWSESGLGFATWTVTDPVPDLPKLAGFAATPTEADAERNMGEIGDRVGALLWYCDRIGCTAEVRATGSRLQRGLAARGRPTLGPAATWARSESGRPEGWSARYQTPEGVLELAVTRDSEGGSGWGLRGTSDGKAWVSAGISSNPTATTFSAGGPYLTLTKDEGLMVSGDALQTR